MNRSTSLLLAALLALASMAVAGCGAKGHRSARPAPVTDPPAVAETQTIGASSSEAAPGASASVPAAKAIETVAGSHPYSRLTLLSLRRTGPKVVTAQLAIGLDRHSDSVWWPNLSEEGSDNESLDGVRLIDEVNGREHFPLRDAEGNCMCSNGLNDRLQPRERIVVSVKFPAPPAEVTFASIQAPGFPAFDAVPLG